MSTLKIFQKGFNFSQDGPGNRLVYHLSGCNFKCKWCSNPEGMIQKNFAEVDVDDIVKECISCVPMFFSNGGVTFTGGEATLQFDALLELLKKLKQNDINTALETNGSHKELYKLIPYVDNLIMDFKHFDSKKHKIWIGNGNEEVIKNFIFLAEKKINVLIRIPLINGFNVEPYGFIDLFKKYDTSKMRFEILTYHEYGKEKWQELYLIKDGFVAKKDFLNFENAFIQNGLKIIHT